MKQQTEGTGHESNIFAQCEHKHLRHTLYINIFTSDNQTDRWENVRVNNTSIS